MGVRHREAAVLIEPPPSRLIRSSSPGARGKKWLVFFSSVSSGTLSALFVGPGLLAPCRKIPFLVLLASLRPACSLRWICSSTHAFVSVRTKPQRRQWRQPQPASKTCSTPTLQISPKLPISFLFFCLPVDGWALLLLCLLSFHSAFRLFLHRWLLQPSRKFHLPGASCSYVLALFAALPLCAVLCN